MGLKRNLQDKYTSFMTWLSIKIWIFYSNISINFFRSM